MSAHVRFILTWHSTSKSRNSPVRINEGLPLISPSNFNKKILLVGC